MTHDGVGESSIDTRSLLGKRAGQVLCTLYRAVTRKAEAAPLDSITAPPKMCHRPVIYCTCTRAIRTHILPFAE